MERLKRENNAFTLAEVLITLGIIGVVASMTLPALINQTRAKELQTGLKKAYSVLQTAYNQMSYDEGQVVNGINYSNQRFMAVFKKYFKKYKDCGLDDCEPYGTSLRYHTYNNNPLDNFNFDDGQEMIVDGMFIFVENATRGEDLFISVDVNGLYKKPNRWGHDLFTFQIMPEGKLLPMGAKGTLYDGQNYCSLTSIHTINGIGCTYKAVTEKDYFKNLPK